MVSNLQGIVPSTISHNNSLPVPALVSISKSRPLHHLMVYKTVYFFSGEANFSHCRLPEDARSRITCMTARWLQSRIRALILIGGGKRPARIHRHIVDLETGIISMI